MSKEVKKTVISTIGGLLVGAVVGSVGLGTGYYLANNQPASAPQSNTYTEDSHYTQKASQGTTEPAKDTQAGTKSTDKSTSETKSTSDNTSSNSSTTDNSNKSDSNTSTSDKSAEYITCKTCGKVTYKSYSKYGYCMDCWLEYGMPSPDDGDPGSDYWQVDPYNPANQGDNMKSSYDNSIRQQNIDDEYLKSGGSPY